MKLAIVINTNEPETAWNALRLGNAALNTGHRVSVFLLGPGVEIEDIKDATYNVAEQINSLTHRRGNLLGCGTCLGMRHREPVKIVKSTLDELLNILADSDKVVSFG